MAVAISSQWVSSAKWPVSKKRTCALSRSRCRQGRPRLRQGLAILDREAASGSRWIHEIKFDGYRVQLRLANESVKVFTRRGRVDHIASTAADIEGAYELLPVLKLEAALKESWKASFMGRYCSPNTVDPCFLRRAPSLSYPASRPTLIAGISPLRWE
jgi:hypothetical protein